MSIRLSSHCAAAPEQNKNMELGWHKNGVRKNAIGVIYIYININATLRCGLLPMILFSCIAKRCILAVTLPAFICMHAYMEKDETIKVNPATGNTNTITLYFAQNVRK